MSRHKTWIVFALAVIAAGAFHCTSGGPIGAPESYTTTGTLAALPVEGLQYRSGDSAGLTGADGAFELVAGEDVELFVGGMSLGAAPAIPTMSVLDFTTGFDATEAPAINMARLLASLDHDGTLENGIFITEQTHELFAAIVPRLGVEWIDLHDDALIDVVIDNVVEAANKTLEGHTLVAVETGTAQDALISSLHESGLHRQRVSRGSDLGITHTDIEVMTELVPVIGADGVRGHGMLHPVIVTYAQEIEGALGSGLFVDVSTDGANTFRTFELSRTGDIVAPANGLADVKDVRTTLAGNYALVTWTDTNCPDRNPNGIAPADDDYGVIGAQGSFRTGAGVQLFRCVWAAELIVDGDGARVHRAAPVTSGVRDAASPDVAVVPGFGFALAWAEHPYGNDLMVGTDVWYTEIAWRGIGTYEVPTRLTDNAACLVVDGDFIGDRYCKRVCERTTADGVCVTEQKSELSGHQGAANPAIAMVPYEPEVMNAVSGEYARVMVAYEETVKGDGFRGVYYHTFTTDQARPEIAAGTLMSDARMNARDAELEVQTRGHRGTTDTRAVLTYREGFEAQTAASLMLRRARFGYAPDDFRAAVNLSWPNVYKEPVVDKADDVSPGEPSDTWRVGVNSDTVGADVLLSGDHIAVVYRWTFDNLAAEKQHLPYDLYLRRSFDGGATWTNAKGTPQVPVLLSHGARDGYTVTDAQLFVTSDADLVVTYATEPGYRVDDTGDIYWARSTNDGESWTTIETIDPYTGDVEVSFDYLAGGAGIESHAGVAFAPGGDQTYAIYRDRNDRGDGAWVRTVRSGPIGLTK